jgi:hypothetical protein
MKNNQKKLWVIVNYLSIALLLVLFYNSQIFSYNKLLLLLFIIPAGSLLLSFIVLYWRTGLWKITHTKYLPENVDYIRRYYIITRISYIIFTIMIISLLFYFSICDKRVDVLLSACLLYIAHILPASIMVWIGE